MGNGRRSKVIQDKLLLALSEGADSYLHTLGCMCGCNINSDCIMHMYLHSDLDTPYFI